MLELLLEQEGKSVPEVKLKIFAPKYGGMKLEDYSTDPGSKFWEKVKKVSWEEVKGMKSKIDPDKLELLATQAGFPDEIMLEKVLKDVREGARIGVSEAYRVSSRSTNAPSAIEHGEEVTDALLEWIDEGYVTGPYEEKEIPFPAAKVSGLMCRMKPNGKARIIINLSKGKPSSVNEGIDKLEFPTAMSSTTAWIRIIWRCGKHCRFTKCDWASAYKQIRVHPDDIWMQGFAWLGRIFFELALVFGAASSPGIYDRLAKVVLFIVMKQVNFPSHLVIQHLDDVCACSPEGSFAVDRFYEAYRLVCEDLGVKLADKADPDKSFAPRTEGQVLGVDYDSTTMTWHLRQDKISIILNIVNGVMEDGEATARVLKKLCGKLIDIRNLIPGARFHLAHLLMAAGSVTESADMEKMVEVDEWCRADLFYFSLVIPVYSHRTKLTDPDKKPDSWAVKSYTNTVGGSVQSLGREAYLESHFQVNFYLYIN